MSVRIREDTGRAEQFCCLGAEDKEYHIVTSQGPATSMVFALKLIELLKGKAEADKVKEGLLA